MKEDTRWKLIAGMALVTLSLALYTAHYLIFQDAHHIIIYLLGDIAFIPIEVLVVTLIIDQMLESREKKQRMEKLNMVIGTFFSTTGTPLLSLLSRADPCIDTLRPSLVVRDNWTDKEFSALKSTVGHYSCGVKEENVDLEALRAFLLDKRGVHDEACREPHDLRARVVHRPHPRHQPPDRGTEVPGQPCIAPDGGHRSTSGATAGGSTPCSSPSGCGTWNTSGPITRTCSALPCGRTRSTPLHRWSSGKVPEPAPALPTGLPGVR